MRVQKSDWFAVGPRWCQLSYSDKRGMRHTWKPTRPFDLCEAEFQQLIAGRDVFLIALNARQKRKPIPVADFQTTGPMQ